MYDAPINADGVEEWPLAVLYVAVFLACTSFSIVMPSIALFLDSMDGNYHYLAVVIAIYSVGETIGSTACGWAATRVSSKKLMLGLLVPGFLGNIGYALSTKPWMVLVTRLVVGLWSGGDQAVQSAYIGRAVSPSMRTQKMTYSGIAVCLGLVLGPAFALIGTFGTVHIGHAKINAFTFPGWLSALFCLGSFVAICFFFRERPLELGDLTDESSADVRSRLLSTQSESTLKLPVIPQSTRLLVVGGTVLINFANLATFSMIETIATPLVEAFFGFTVRDANFMFVGGAVIQFGTFLVVLQLLGRGWNERRMMIGALILQVASFSLMISKGSGKVVGSDSGHDPSGHSDLQLWRFLLGFGLFNVGFPIARILMQGIYSKTCQGLGFEQGTTMGWLVASAAIARIAGPFWAVYLFQSSVLALFISVSGVLVVGLLLCIPLHPFWAGHSSDNNNKNSNSTSFDPADDSYSDLHS